MKEHEYNLIEGLKNSTPLLDLCHFSFGNVVQRLK